MKQKYAETQRKLYQEVQLKIWNKGLTMDDERVKNDIRKDKIAKDFNYKLLRFWKFDIKNNLNVIVEELKKYK